MQSKFSTIRAGLLLLGITDAPRAIMKASRICAGVRLYLTAARLTYGRPLVVPCLLTSLAYFFVLERAGPFPVRNLRHRHAS